jgi:hypothetical protein
MGLSLRPVARLVDYRPITLVAFVIACTQAPAGGAPAPATGTVQSATTTSQPTSAATQTAANRGPGGPGQGGSAFPASPPDTAAASREQMMNEVLASIAGREMQPAESVFKNVKSMKGQQAGRLVRTMNIYGRSLGVGCAHCHVVNRWESEEKPTLQITRDMAAMAQAITREYLTKIPNIKSERPTVNCSTCHRGVARPGAAGPGGPGGPGGARPPG